MLDMMAEFHAGGGTVLLVTHEEHAAGYADRTVRIRQGCIEDEVPAAPEG